MGKVKSELTPKKSKTVSMFSRFTKKKVTKQDKAQNLADNLQLVDEKLDALLRVKEAELGAERGQEDTNRKSLALLRTMRFHVDQCIDAAASYGDSN